MAAASRQPHDASLGLFLQTVTFRFQVSADPAALRWPTCPALLPSLQTDWRLEHLHPAIILLLAATSRRRHSLSSGQYSSHGVLRLRGHPRIPPGAVQPGRAEVHGETLLARGEL